MARVSLRHLDKRYPGDHHAVRDVNLEIADGEFLVLVGPSGCGKSTTLRLIAGLEDATSGEIYIGDSRVNDAAPSERDVAMVFQNYALYPHMTVRENLAFGLKMRRAAKAGVDERVRNTADMLSIGALLERRPRELSGGERQRVALGRAIVREPKVFLFDEPLSNLDANLRIEMRAEIARLHRRLGTTVIYVTHDQAEALTLGQRIALMEHGVIQQVDTPMNIYRRPTNRFVGAFIGSPPMNFFAGDVQSGVFRLAAGGAVAVVGAPADGPATLGIRPEDLLTTINGNAARLADVTVDVVEPMGYETIVHFQLGGASHAARLAGEAAVKPGDQLALAVRPAACHLFASDRAAKRLN